MRESGAGYLLLALALVSLMTITVELTTRYLDPVRGFIAAGLAPAQVVAELPYMAGDVVSEALATQESLRSENTELKRRLLELSQVTQQYPALKAENERLRELLDSRDRPYRRGSGGGNSGHRSHRQYASGDRRSWPGRGAACGPGGH